jgi:hypothetical protein
MDKEVVRSAFTEAQKLVDSAIDETLGTRKPSSRDEAIKYQMLHKGNPWAMAEHMVAQGHKGPGIFTAMREYEQRMENYMKHYGLK